MSTEQRFMDYVKKMSAYNEALSVLYWDMRTGAPKKGLDRRSETVGVLSGELYRMSTSSELDQMLKELEDRKEELSPVVSKTVEEERKNFNLSSKIPEKEYEEYVVLLSKAESVWEEAKEKSDFAMFAPYLEKIVETYKRFIGYWGVKEGNPYNTLLDQYEPDMTTDNLDEVFSDLRSKIVPLVKQIAESPNKPNTEFLVKQFSKDQQEKFSHALLKQLGYDFEAGRLDETVHPFQITLNRGDVRITTKYDENDFRSAIFGTIHECGHALYEQNVAEELDGTPLSAGTSMGIHESQSLFYENFIGRNENFWIYNYELLQQHSPAQFGNVALEDFIKAINESKPSLIRIEADELTYPLHIMIRYEIEKGLFNGDLKVADLPQIWNDKYEEYLGIRPENDGEGVLQDVHWSSGLFGYFPSYALGFLYAAQLKAAMNKDIPNFDDLCRKGDFAPILSWLTEKVHRHGKMKKPLEILQEATGEGLNAEHLVNHLRSKYADVYQLN